jgi:regulator of protease activity HflC (stomatin/prohibitin superfamily)
MSPWDARAEPPPQTAADAATTPVIASERGATNAATLTRATSELELIVADAQREAAARVADEQREAREREAREQREAHEREAHEREAREQREAEQRERIDALGAATSEVTHDAVLRIVGWGLGTLVAGVALHWLTTESRGARPASRRSRRRHQEALS